MRDNEETRPSLLDPGPAGDPDNPGEANDLTPINNGTGSGDEYVPETPDSIKADGSTPEEGDTEQRVVPGEPVLEPVTSTESNNSKEISGNKPVSEEPVKEEISTTETVPPNQGDKENKSSEERLSIISSLASREPSQLALALKTALGQARTRKPRVKAWLDLTQELFASIYVKVRGPTSRLSDAAKRFPQLKAAEVERVLDLFELMVIDEHKDWELWRQRVTSSAVIAQKTTQSFESILWKAIGQAKVLKEQKLPPTLQGWANKVTGKTTTMEQDMKLANKTFLFKTSLYSPEEITQMRAECEKEYGKYAPMQVREGTVVEWKIVQGLVEGTIIAKKLPQFLKRIMKTEEQVKLVHTIRAQVEGCLVLDLRGENIIKEAFMSTKSIQESIATAATTRGTAGPELWRMIAQLKSISYDSSKHALYFHFFTRDMARKFAGITVPFHRYDHVLKNLHDQAQATSGSAWERQRDRNGESFEPKGYYACVLKNVTRSVDLLKLSNFLKKRLQMEFQLDDLDKNGPFSDTSTSWELIVESDACPTVLLDVKRIYWGHTMIIVEHPSMRGKKQCLRCGELGHPMRQCRTALTELLKKDCIHVKLEELKKYEAPTQTFRSMEELRAQVEAVRERQLAEKGKAVPEETSGTTTDNTSSEPKAACVTPCKTTEPCNNSTEVKQHVVQSNEPSQRKQLPEWITVTKKKQKSQGRQQSADEKEEKEPIPQVASSLQRAIQQSSEQKVHPISTKSEIGHDKQRQDSHPPKTKKRKSKLERKKAKEEYEVILQKKASAFLMLEGRAKTVIKEVIEEYAKAEGPIIRLQPLDREEDFPQDSQSVSQLFDALRMRKVPTPPTGNCQLYAVCQSLTGSDKIIENERVLEKMTKALKEGCLARALMDFEEKISHEARKSTLKELGRIKADVSTTESRKQFQQYLLEFAESSSTLTDNIPRKAWGSNDTLMSISTLLQRDIYVLSHPPSAKCPGFNLFTPEMRTKRGKTYQISGEYPITMGIFYERMKKFLTEVTEQDYQDKRPIILEYSGQHYAAILSGDRQWPSGDVDMNKGNDEDNEEEEMKSSGQEGAPDCDRSEITQEIMESDESVITNYGGCSPWDPDEWDGNIEDILHRLNGPTIHHALKCEIADIIRTRDSRMRELLHFLTDTVSKLSLPEQEGLLAANLEDPATEKYFLQKYQISKPILEQWYHKVWADTQPEQEILLISDGSTSDSDYKPSEMGDNSQDIPEPGERNSPTSKRLCRREQTEETAESMELVPVERELMDEFMKCEKETLANPLSLENFNITWHNLILQWEEQTGVPFPLISSTKTLWVKAAQREGNRLLHLLKDIPGTHYILDSVHSNVLVELTKKWREQCWLEVVEAGKREGLLDIPGTWFTEWETRYTVMRSHSQKMAIINSSQEWTQLRKIQYGGNTILKLLAPRQVLLLATMLISSHIFAEQLAAMMGNNYNPTDTILCLFQRHLRVMDDNQEYAAKFTAIEKREPTAWKELFEYMYSEDTIQAKVKETAAQGEQSLKDATSY